MKNKFYYLKSLWILFIVFGVLICQAQNNFELRKRILSSTDDAEERQTGGVIDITSSDIELVNDGTTPGNQTVGMRFTGINIPKDATIVNAYIQFWVDENTHTAATNLTITGEAIDNSSTFSTAGYNLTNRSKTNANVAWSNLPIWGTLNAAGTDQRTPEIKTILQEIMNRSGWQQGNAVTIFINGTGRRNAHAYDGVPSMAPELVITYKLKNAPVTAFPITKNSIWSYNDSGYNLPSDWKNINYNDSNWNFYYGKFGYGNGNEQTTLGFGSNANNKFITTHFRKKFTVADSSQIDSLIFKLQLDAGAVVHLNGTELFRRNMPNGTITNTTTALNAVYGNDENNYFEHRIGAKLRNGINILAVEVHLADPESVDMGFDMEVFAKKPTMKVVDFPLQRGAEWYYNDNGTNLYNTNWTAENYAQETLWNYGNAALGYGDPMTTTISFGSNSANKYVAYFFRKKLNIIDTALINSDSISLFIRRDDGAVVYVNGIEVARQNMPNGTLDNRTKSLTIIDGTNETIFFKTNISKSYFKNGINQIAVAVHQRDSISSDLGFDMEISKYIKPNAAALGCIDGENHIGCFTSLVPAAQTTRLIIPPSHNFQQILKQGTPYTLNTGNIPSNHDFTAYIPRNGSSKDGALSINHENSPGGVTMAYVRYIDSTQLWVVDSSRAVNFGVGNLVATIRNCSGGITPWGTVITSEESVNTTDANLDGYLDFGWNIEINPWTGKVLDYGTGSAQKLWALGRMNHENVVIAQDSITVYQGEDGGTHLVYKFVADNKMNLSSGKLYVLKIDKGITSGEPNGSTGKWIRVPNTTQADRNNTSSLALAVGGTQFNGVEDVEIGTIDGKIYFTAKGLNRTYRFKDGDSTFTEFETFVGGKTYTINTGNGYVDEAWAIGNDNLTFDNKGNLYVLQDGSRNHLWMVRPDHTQAEPKVELFMKSPLSSEPTGMTFTPDYKFMFVSLQHPSSSNVAQLDATGKNIQFNLAAVAVIARKENLGITLPNVIISASKRKIRVGDSIAFEDKSFPVITKRTWVFEGINDSISNLKNVTKTYTNTGIFKVKITVENKAGSITENYIQYIEVIPALPKANFTQTAVDIFEGDSIIFTDLSTGVVTERSWIFEGSNLSTTSDSIVKLKFNQYGTYSVTLKVGNNNEMETLTKNLLITVKRKKPIVNFTQTATTITRGASIKFTDISLNKIENRKWTFTGGTLINSKLTDSIVTLKYDIKGKYNAKLWVKNAAGADSVIKNLWITVLPPAIIPNFTSDKTQIETEELVSFSDMSTGGEVLTRLWKFEGGYPQTSYDPNPNVVYLTTGKYKVELIVNNEAGEFKEIKTQYIHVSTPKLSLSTTDSLNKLSVYPNPFTNQINFTIALNAIENIEVSLLNTNGQVIKTYAYNNLTLGSNSINCNVEDLNLQSGIYMLNVKIGNQEIKKLIIKQ